MQSVEIYSPDVLPEGSGCISYIKNASFFLWESSVTQCNSPGEAGILKGQVHIFLLSFLGSISNSSVLKPIVCICECSVPFGSLLLFVCCFPVN